MGRLFNVTARRVFDRRLRVDYSTLLLKGLLIDAAQEYSTLITERVY
jgi:hypothetical protein